MKKIYYWHYAVVHCLLLQLVVMTIMMQPKSMCTEKMRIRYLKIDAEAQYRLPPHWK